MEEDRFITLIKGNPRSPHNCYLYVRNVHVESKKLRARELFQKFNNSFFNKVSCASNIATTSGNRIKTIFQLESSSVAMKNTGNDTPICNAEVESPNHVTLANFDPSLLKTFSVGPLRNGLDPILCSTACDKAKDTQ